MSRTDELVHLLSAMGCDKIKVDSDAFGEKILCCCPMHRDTNPSFMLRPDTFVFNCFSCGSGHELPDGRNPRSGLINLYRKHMIEQTGKCPSVKDSVHFVSKYVTLPNQKPRRRKKAGDAYNLRPVPESYLAAYCPSEHHYKYMLRRGFSQVTLDQNEIGFDRIKKRVVFPIRDSEGQLVTFVGRSILPKDKIDTINKKREAEGLKPHPRYLIYYKAPRRFLLGFAQYLDDHDEIIVVESMMDALALRQLGYDNVFSILGSHVSDYQWSLIKDKSVIYAFLDNDSAGADGVISLVKRAKNEPDSPKILIPQYEEDDSDFDEADPDRVHELVLTALSYDAMTKKTIPYVD